MPLVNLKKVADAIERAKKEAKPRRFKQSVELIVKLRDVDIRIPENRINEIVTLPCPPQDKLSKVCVIGKGDLILKAKEAGADLVLEREDIEKYGANRRALRKLAKAYDFFIAEADLMPLIGRYFGPILGPRGKMPIPIPPTADPKPLIERLRRSIRIRIRNQPQVMCRVGVEDMNSMDIAKNVDAVFTVLARKYRVPQNIEKVYVKLTMGPAVPVDPW
ncbi:MAG: 50S ribosomal protein L1 [Thermoprotei archaeon]|nr:MAG: 50S ribosomal protein L1 [Thermoprotei archaeon]RLF24530.1 MAG: 50S ribosomal protein L1 [Thermoprotei archaeon]